MPLKLGKLHRITINVAPEVDRTGCSQYRYLAEARLSYTGSPLLWRYSPGGYSEFPYRGVAASTSVGWRKFITSKDVEPFETEVRQVLAKTQAELADFSAEVRRIDGYIDNRIDGFIKTRLTYKL